MATVREIRAMFTAEAKGIQTAFKQIRQEASKLSADSKRTTSEVNKHYDSLSASTDKLKRALQDTNNVDAFSELTAASDRAQRELRETGQVSGEAMDEMERSIQDAARRFNSLGPEARSSFDDVGRAIESVSGELNNLRSTAGGSLDSLAGASSGARGDLNDVSRAAGDLDADLRDLGSDNGLQDVEEDANSLGDTLSGLGGTGGAIAGVGGAFVAASAGLLGFVAAGAGIFSVVKGGDELQGALNDLQVQTGSTKEEMEGMKESLVDIYGGNYGDGFDDIATSIAQVKGATQLTGRELELATTKALLLRDSFDWEVPETMNAVRTMMIEFGISAEEAMTLLAQGQQMGINGAEDLLDTFNEYSGAFADLGFNGEQSMNMIANAVKAGARNTDIAADAVNEFATRIMDGSDTTRDALVAAGLDADVIIAKFNKGGPEAAEAFGQVTEAIGGIGNASLREQTAVGLFGRC